MTRLLLPLALALALTVAGCGQPRPDDVPVVVSAIGGAATPGDPSARALDFPQRVLMGATAQGLVRFDANGQIQPGLAERWIVIDDGLSYIFRLREAVWPDGKPVTAAQVVRVLRRAAAADSANPLQPNLQVIGEIVEMTPQVIEVRLRRPRPDLLKLFAQPELAIFEPESLDGTGPFRPIGARGDALLLRPVRNPGAAEDEDNVGPSPEEHVLLRGERAALAIARFAARDSDLVLGGTFVDWPIVGYAGVAPANIRLDDPVGLFGLAVVNPSGVLEAPENRAAVAMAIDRAALTAAIHPDWQPVETLLPAQLDSAQPPARPDWAGTPIEQRRATARARIAVWRRAHPDTPPRVRVALPQGPGATLMWGAIGPALIAIGLQPELVAIDADADLRLIDLVAPYDSGRWFLAQACRKCSDTAALLIEAARDAPTLEARGQRIAEADAEMARDTAYIPIAQPLRWSMVALRLGAWQRNPRAWHPLDHLRNDTE